MQLSIGDESISLTAPEMDAQIEYLAKLRAQMRDRVPDAPPPIHTVISNPAYSIRTDSMTKAALLRLRHEGYGWLNFELPPLETINMRKTWSDIVFKLGLDVAYGEYEGPERRVNKPH